MSATLAERIASRARLTERYGYDPMIPEAVADQIRAAVAEFRVIVAEEFSGFTQVLHVNPRTDISVRRVLDSEAALMRQYGNPPFNYYCDFTHYRITFRAQ